MLIRILGFEDRRAPVPHSRDVLARPPPAPDPDTRRMEIDASPWGGGGVLIEDGHPVRYFACAWLEEDFVGMNVDVGSSAAQTFFEVLVLVLAVELWGDGARPSVLAPSSPASTPPFPRLSLIFWSLGPSR